MSVNMDEQAENIKIWLMHFEEIRHLVALTDQDKELESEIDKIMSRLFRELGIREFLKHNGKRVDELLWNDEQHKQILKSTNECQISR